jgi:hypothetical protein
MRNSLYVGFSMFSQGSKLGSVVWSAVNATGNRANEQASGIYVGAHRDLTFKFASFSLNSPKSTLFFDQEDGTHVITCLFFTHNICSGTTALIMRKSMQFTACIFQHNTISSGGLFGTGYDQTQWWWGYGTQCTITFVDCIFDVVPATTTLLTVKTTACMVTAGEEIPWACSVTPTGEFTPRARYKYRAVHYVMAIEALTILLHIMD